MGNPNPITAGLTIHFHDAAGSDIGVPPHKVVLLGDSLEPRHSDSQVASDLH
jgi:hypothetical protein